ncbi:MAG TPA: glucose-6-phosphate isomerase [Spirochaetes bacterium]|nr:glucose-6-phosphate isomerase [Spirochaetota bacterium]
MLKFDYNYFMKDFIGAEHGFAESDLSGGEGIARSALERMENEKSRGLLGFLEVPFDGGPVEDILEFREKHLARFASVAVIGIGGSALGGQALRSSLSHLYLNELGEGKTGNRKKTYFFDNVDPYEIRALTEIMDLSKTLFLVISKSGGTTETNANFAILLDMVKKAPGTDYREQFVAVTDPKSGVLRKLAEKEGFRTFPVPSNVGGRFSGLTPVGLAAAAFMDIDIARLMEGARAGIERFYGKPLMENAPLLNALFHYLFDKKKNKRINVLMPYTRKLYLFADWYRQLWAESLGKCRDLEGKPTVAGLTPVPALGTIDQHSQLQLYLEGPNDKVVTFLKLDRFDEDIVIPEFYTGTPELEYLSHKSLRELNRFEESATELVLKEASRPSASIILPQLNEQTVGELIIFMEMQTAYAGYMYNINPYDQPAVEQGKKFTFGLLDRPGFADYRATFEEGYRKLDKFIL